MSELEPITCPRCGTVWYVDPGQLEGPDQVLYKSLDRRARVESYRVRCPTCGTHIVLDVEVEEAGDG